MTELIVGLAQYSLSLCVAGNFLDCTQRDSGLRWFCQAKSGHNVDASASKTIDTFITVMLRDESNDRGVHSSQYKLIIAPTAC